MIGSQYLRTHLQWNRWCAKCCLYRIMELSRGRALIWWVLVWNRIPSEVALPALPPLCPSDCTGNVTTRRFSMFGIETKQNYVWAIRNPQRTKCRCTLPEVAINCWESCCTSCTGDAAGTPIFEVPELGGAKHDCAWAVNTNSMYRCSLKTILTMCCETCAMAVSSEGPSSIPSKELSLEPSNNPRNHPS